MSPNILCEGFEFSKIISPTLFSLSGSFSQINHTVTEIVVLFRCSEILSENEGTCPVPFITVDILSTESGQIIQNRSLATAHNLFTVARMEQPRPCQWHPSNTVPCIIAGCRQFLATTELKPFRNFHEAYSEDEKRFGDRHILNCHNHVYNTNKSTLRILG